MDLAIQGAPAGIWSRSRWTRHEFRLSHTIPVLVQSLLLGYWALHWAPLRDRLSTLIWLLPLGVALDFALSWKDKTGPRWSYAALPVVLSSTIYTNYPPEHGYWMALVIVVGLLSKKFLKVKGRHVFNPSAFGLAVLGYLTLFDLAPLQDMAHPFSSPPNMVEVLLCLALIVQLRLPVVLVTIGATAGLAIWALFQIGLDIIPGASGLNFTPGWAPVMVVLVLLLTDPATSPRTASGRLFFGALCGVLMGFWGDLLLWLGHPDFFGKILSVPMANALVPWLDKLGARVDERLTWLHRRHNAKHVAMWFALGVGMFLLDGKESHYSSNLWVHQSSRPTLIHVGADGVPTCDENPIYCQPFSFVSEARCWAATAGMGQPCGDDSPFDAAKMAPYLRHHWGQNHEGRRPIPLSGQSSR
ncbi:MAG: hypothetical protein CMH53_09265 [Myxococcales bacterium]|nr:hypothetical protein [Myxococcales bacterium]